MVVLFSTFLEVRYRITENSYGTNKYTSKTITLKGMGRCSELFTTL